MTNEIIEHLVFGLISIVAASALHSLIRPFLLASVAAALSSTVLFHLAV
jgi:hypothetical protein